MPWILANMFSKFSMAKCPWLGCSVVDPNPKESEYFGWIRIRQESSDLFSDSDPYTVKKTKKFREKSHIKHLKEKKHFQLENVFLCRTDSRTHIKAMRGPI
jgi:hypothetical protein